jgi:hypothetical protein
MTFADAVAAIRSRLGNPFGSVPLAYPNESFDPPDDGGSPPSPLPWIYLEVLGGPSDMTAFNSPGKRVVTERGTIFAHCFVPVGTGDQAAYQLAGEVGAALRMAAFSGIQTEAASIGGGESGDDSGNWFRVSVSVPFTVHYAA